MHSSPCISSYIHIHLYQSHQDSSINVFYVLYLSLNSAANLPNGPCPGLKVPWRQYNVWCPLHINVVLGSQIASLGNTYTREDVLLMLLEHQSVRIYDQREGHCC